MADIQMQEKSKQITKQLRAKATEFLGSRKNANNLVDIMQYFETGSHTSACLLTLELIFTELLKRREMCEASGQPSTLAQYRVWLKTAYNQIWNRLLLLLEEGRTSEQSQALTTAMKFIAWEGKYPLDSEEPNFPISKLKAVLTKLLSSNSNTSHLITSLQEYTAYSDVLYITWKLLPGLTPKAQPNSEIFIKNLLELIDKAPVEKHDGKTSDTSIVMLCGLNGKSTIHFEYSTVKKSINKVCYSILRWEHTLGTHKQLLLVLLERILPHLDNPMLLTDFLMDSLDMGGPVSVIALQGIFQMMRLHNLDYPNFFEKLYSMFEPEIFHSKCKARLFYLADMFLNSTHLPETLVAAFAKRLARLTLVSPSEDILIIIMFVGNLILRHPGLKRLINTPDCQVTFDPFIMDERDPYKSMALESSLWEIKLLQTHALPNIATAARFIDLPLPSIEWDLSKVLDSTLDDTFGREIKKKANEILTFNKPQSLALPKDEALLQYWQLTSS